MKKKYIRFGQFRKLLVMLQRLDATRAKTMDFGKSTNPFLEWELRGTLGYKLLIY